MKSRWWIQYSSLRIPYTFIHTVNHGFTTPILGRVQLHVLIGLNFTQDGKTVWDETNLPEKYGDKEFNFMKWALMYSTTYDSIALRLRSALLAQQQVAGYISGDLREDQWKYEMENLFATSLARVQFDAWAIASGEGQNEPGYKREQPPPDDPMNFCGLFKFRASGYVNIALWPMIIVLLATPTIWFLSVDVKDLLFWKVEFPPTPPSEARPSPQASTTPQREDEGAVSSTEADPTQIPSTQSPQGVTTASDFEEPRTSRAWVAGDELRGAALGDVPLRHPVGQNLSHHNDNELEEEDEEETEENGVPDRSDDLEGSIVIGFIILFLWKWIIIVFVWKKLILGSRKILKWVFSEESIDWIKDVRIFRRNHGRNSRAT
jgi:hypothetical protein